MEEVEARVIRSPMTGAEAAVVSFCFSVVDGFGGVVLSLLSSSPSWFDMVEGHATCTPTMVVMVIDCLLLALCLLKHVETVSPWCRWRYLLFRWEETKRSSLNILEHIMSQI